MSSFGENICVILCRCICALFLLPFSILYTILKCFYDLICCTNNNKGYSNGDFGSGIKDSFTVGVKELVSVEDSVDFTNRPLQFI